MEEPKDEMREQILPAVGGSVIKKATDNVSDSLKNRVQLMFAV